MRNAEIDKVFLTKLAILSFVIRITIAVPYYNILISAMKRPLYAFDGEAYSIMGWYIALILKGVNVLHLASALVPNDYCILGGLFGTINHLAPFLPPTINYGVGVYSYIIGVFYYIFGYAPLLLRVFNISISIMTAYFAYLISAEYFSKRSAKTAYVIMLFMPSFVLYSASLQRDTLVNFLILIISAAILVLGRMKSVSRSMLVIIIALVSAVLLRSIREHASTLLFIFIIFYLLTRFYVRFSMLSLVIGLIALSSKPMMIKIFELVRDKSETILGYHFSRTYLGGSMYRLLDEHYYDYAMMTMGVGPRGIPIIDLLRGYINGLYAFLFKPSIFSMTKTYQLLALPQMLLWYAILAFSLIGFYRSFKNITAEKLALILLLILFSVTVGVAEANFETLIRHRDMVVPFYIIFGAYGMEYVSKLRGGKR